MKCNEAVHGQQVTDSVGDLHLKPEVQSIRQDFKMCESDLSLNGARVLHPSWSSDFQRWVLFSSGVWGSTEESSSRDQQLTASHSFFLLSYLHFKHWLKYGRDKVDVKARQGATLLCCGGGSHFFSSALMSLEQCHLVKAGGAKKLFCQAPN